MGYIEPEPILLETKCFADSENEEMVNKNHYGYFIPFRETWTKTIENLPEYINLYHEPNQFLKNDYFDGNYVKKKPQFLKSKTKLAILIFTDDLEVTNINSINTLNDIGWEFIFASLQLLF